MMSGSLLLNFRDGGDHKMEETLHLVKNKKNFHRLSIKDKHRSGRPSQKINHEKSLISYELC